MSLHGKVINRFTQKHQISKYAPCQQHKSNMTSTPATGPMVDSWCHTFRYHTFGCRCCCSSSMIGNVSPRSAVHNYRFPGIFGWWNRGVSWMAQAKKMEPLVLWYFFGEKDGCTDKILVYVSTYWCLYYYCPYQHMLFTYILYTQNKS